MKALQPPKPPDKRSSNWQANQLAIRTAFAEWVAANGRFPTQAQIVEKTGLSKNTVSNHFKEINFSDISPEINFLISSVIAEAGRRALAGCIKSQGQLLNLVKQTAANADLVQSQAVYFISAVPEPDAPDEPDEIK